MTALRIALAAHLATHRIKLVHVWQTGAHWSAMLEWPYDPALRKPLVTEAHATGVAETPEQAVIAGLDRLGIGYGLEARLWVLGYLMR